MATGTGSITARVLWLLGALAGVVIAVSLLVTNPGALGAIISLGLTAAVVMGIVIRLIKAPKGRKLRDSLGPVAGAAETYQELLVGREPTSSLIEHSFPVAGDDRTTGGP